MSLRRAAVGAKKRKVSGISMTKVARVLSLCSQAGARLACQARGEGRHCDE